MLKKAAFLVLGLGLTVTLMAAPKAVAQVHIGVSIGAPVVVAPVPVVVQPAPYVVYGGPYIAAHYWDSGYHGGYYYDHGARYRWEHGHRHYDDGYREGRARYEHGHHGGDHHDHWRGDR